MYSPGFAGAFYFTTIIITGCYKSMKKMVMFFSTLFGGMAAAQTPLQTVDNVDLNRYAGKWYEIASFPASFQRNCTCTTAEYTVTDKGYVEVLNKCNKKSPQGRLAKAHGKAYVVDTTTNARLKVTFFKPFYGDYNIIDLAPDYSYAVVGTVNRNYMWVLSRKPVIDDAVYNGILSRATAKGFDTNRLVKTLQVQ